ncbi:MAG: glycosyltransferase [Pseudomonadota bacterium]
MLLLSLMACAAWFALIAFWGGFWRGDQRLPEAGPPGTWPEVVAVIPARDEAETIDKVVHAHAEALYPGTLHVIVVDDGSEDATAQLAQEAAGDLDVTVIPAPPLPEGWSGKMNAVAAGLEEAKDIAPDARYVLLTDADILHEHRTLASMVSFAEGHDLALVSLMARLDSRGIWGSLLIPAFVFFFQKLYPFPLVNQPGHKVAAAAGGCVLVRRDILEAAGGVAEIKDELIDDCALARRIKHHDGGQRIWLGLADREVISLRDNRDFASIWTMVSRTAYAQLDRSPLMLLACIAGMALLYLVPIAAMVVVVSGLLPFSPFDPITFAAGYVALWWMGTAYSMTVQRYGMHWSWSLTLPIAAIIYTGMTIGSAVQHWRGRGGQWKGRTYP